MRSKYGAKKITVDGIVFDSKKEAMRYAYLKHMEGTQVFNLELQPEFVLVPSFKLAGETIRGMKYKADFRYKNISGQTIVEDVKASETFVTDVYKIKRKLFQFNYCREGNFIFAEVYTPGDVSNFH